MDTLDLIYSSVKDTQKDVRHLVDSINELKTQVRINTIDLAEHKEGVIQNRSRICRLEQPFSLKTAMLVGGKVLAQMCALAGAVVAMIKIFN